MTKKNALVAAEIKKTKKIMAVILLLSHFYTNITSP
jgi:hypothetical protein